MLSMIPKQPIQTADGGQQYIFNQNASASAGIAEFNRIKNGGAQIIKGGGQAINNELYDTAVKVFTAAPLRQIPR